MKWDKYKMETLGERNRRNKEIIEKSEIVQEDKEKNRRMMKTPEHHLFMTLIDAEPRPSVYGVALMTDGEAPLEEIKKAKEYVVEYICDCIRDVAKRKPDEFFIIKTPTNEIFNKTSVGAKFILPTVFDDEEAIGRE